MQLITVYGLLYFEGRVRSRSENLKTAKQTLDGSWTGLKPRFSLGDFVRAMRRENKNPAP